MYFSNIKKIVGGRSKRLVEQVDVILTASQDQTGITMKIQSNHLKDQLETG